MTNKKLWLLLLVASAFAFALGGCSASDDDGDDGGIVDPPIGREATCEGCHTSEAMLKATVEPDQEPPESEGEG
jgi:hypothetical protein